MRLTFERTSPKMPTMNKLKISAAILAALLLTANVVYACITKDLSHPSCSKKIEVRLCESSEQGESWMTLCLDIDNESAGCTDVLRASNNKRCTGTHTCNDITKKLCGKPKAGKTWADGLTDPDDIEWTFED